MSLLDTPYYIRNRGARGGSPIPGLLPPGPAALNFGTHGPWEHPYRSSMRDDVLLDHRLRNMGLYDDEEDAGRQQQQQQQQHRDVGPGISPPTSPRSPIAAALASFSSLPTAYPLAPFATIASSNPYTRSAHGTRGTRVSAVELRRHQAATGLLDDLEFSSSELPEVPVGDAYCNTDFDELIDATNPLGARVIVEDDQYVIEAPTPGVPRERLSLEFVGLRRLELVVAPPPASGTCTPDSSENGELETVEVEGPAAGTTTRRRTSAAGARVRASPAQKMPEIKVSVRLPADCDVTSTSSSYVDGVLRVIVPRVPEGTSLPERFAAAEAEEARERKKKLEEARAQLTELEASVKEAEERLRDVIMERRAVLAEVRTAVPIV